MRTKRTLGVVAAVLLALLTARGALRVAAYLARRSLAAARFGFYLLTLQLYRRCPDCKAHIHHDARVCRHCGFRRRPKPGAQRR
ncbi:MAG TPA: hypothetical protein VMD48_04160 [Solirubrobacteraceae bacterium]|nr:hypothetical protein [Solirubrobacteraceae bacterium]